MRRNDNVVIFKQDGAKRYIEFTGKNGRNIVHSVKQDGLIRSQFIAWMNRYPNRVFKGVNTVFNPEFALSNPQADYVDAMANLSADNLGGVRRRVKHNLRKSWRALASYDSGRGKIPDSEAGRWLQEAVDNGLMFGSKFYGDTDEVARDLAKKIKKDG